MKRGAELHLKEPSTGPICDFCSAKDIYCDYPASDFNVWQIPKPDGGRVNVNSESHWAACKACADLIDADNWSGLLDRSVETFRRKYNSADMHVPELRKSIAEMHRLFRENRRPVH